MASLSESAPKPNGTEPMQESTTVHSNAGASLSNSYSNAVITGKQSSNPGFFNSRQATFSNAVNTQLRNQGVAFDTLEAYISLEEYLDAISKEIPPLQVTHISKVSRTVQIYFTHSSWANQLVANGLEIRDHHLDVRPIATAPTKVIVSNVPPEVGHQWLRSVLSKYGKVIGPIKTLNAATQRKEYAHIKSFRRMVLMEFSDDEALNNLPSVLNFTLNEKPYSFYTSVDMKCFRCKKMGHIRANCPEARNVNFTDNSEGQTTNLPSQSVSVTEKVPVISNPDFPQLEQHIQAPNETAEMDQSSQESEMAPPPQIQSKRKRKNVTSSPESHEKKILAADTILFDDQKNPPLNDKIDYLNAPGTSSSESFHSLGTPDVDSDSSSVFSEIEYSNELDGFEHLSPLPTEQLVSFLIDVKGSAKRLAHAKKYTSDINGLILQLKKLVTYLKLSNIKSKTFSVSRVKRVYTGLAEDFHAQA